MTVQIFFVKGTFEEKFAANFFLHLLEEEEKILGGKKWQKIKSRTFLFRRQF